MFVWASSSTSTTCGLRARMASTSISSKIVDLYSSFLRGTVSSREESSTIGLRHADHDFFAAARTPHAFTQHGVRLSHARCVAQKQLEHRRPLCRITFLKPLFWSLRHRRYSPRRSENCRI